MHVGCPDQTTFFHGQLNAWRLSKEFACFSRSRPQHVKRATEKATIVCIL